MKRYLLTKVSSISWRRHWTQAAVTITAILVAMGLGWHALRDTESSEPKLGRFHREAQALNLGKGAVRDAPKQGAAPNAVAKDDSAPKAEMTKGKGGGPGAESESLWREFAKARHQIQGLKEQESALPQNKGVRYFAGNPGQEITARFTDDGVRIESGRGGSWQGTVQMASVSRAEQKVALQAAEPSAKGARVDYPRGDIVEWYENRKEGFEQGFTLVRNPVASDLDQAEQSPLRITVKFAGLTALPQGNDNEVHFKAADGSAVLSYGHLKVWDAKGASVPAEMHADGDLVTLVVADAHAVYPVTVDPLIATLEQKLGPEVTGTGAAGDLFGAAVAVDGETAVIGMPGDDLPSGVNAGSAYVFLRTASLWALQARLTASDGTPGAAFGSSVAVSGNTAVIGTAAMMQHPTSAPSTQSVHPAGSLTEAGNAYVFVRSGNSWTQQAILGHGTESFATFGNAVAVSGDTALVGDAGAEKVHVFLRSGTSWARQQVLMAGDTHFGDRFGSAVALSGNTALIGAPFAGGQSQPASQVAAFGSASGAAYVFVRNGVAWTQQTRFSGENTGDQFGASTAVSGDTALVGAPGADPSAVSNAGLAYLYARSGTSWTLASILTASDASANAAFGSSVGVGPGRALVGAPLANAAYIFEPISMTTVSSAGVTALASWEQMAKLRATDANGDDHFGAAVALNAETALVGTPYDDTRAGQDAGSAFVFVHSDLGCCEQADPNNRGSWCQQARLSAGDAAISDHFGLPLAIENNTAVIGALGDDSPAGTDTGAVYVFVRNGVVWSMQARLTASDGAAFDGLGSAVALSGDTVLAGAPGTDTAGGQDAGSVVVFGRSNGHWSQLARIVAPDGAASDGFGGAVALEGYNVLVGAPGDDTTAGESAGSAYVFWGWEANWWSQTKLTASDGAAFDSFGQSVSLSGNTALVGAMGHDLNLTVDAGSAYVFVSNNDQWNQQARLTATPFSAQDFFGRSVALSGDLAVVGADLADTPAGADTGAAFVFKRSGASWTQEARLTAGDGATGDAFGRSVALKGSIALATARGDDNAGGTDAGSAYAFRRSGSTWNQEVKLTANDPAPADFFGSSVAISGNTVLVGAEGDDGLDTLGGIAADQGGVYVFRLSTASGADILVEHPLDAPLIDGQSAIDFGSLVVGGHKEEVVYIRNTGAQNLTGIKATIDGTNKLDFKLVSSPPGILAPQGLTSFIVSFDPLAVGSRTATLKIASSDPDANPFDVQLTGSSAGAVRPDIVSESGPHSQLVPLGSGVSFSASATGQPAPKVQWKRNGSNIPEATLPTLTFGALLSSAGVYEMVATNSAGSDTSTAAELGVVDTSVKTLILPVGATAVMTVITAGNGLSHVWLKGTSPYSDNRASVSANGKTLTITGLVVGDAGTYACRVTGPGGVLIGGIYHLIVISGPPQIIEPIHMPSGTVGVPYTFTVPINPDPALAPASFGATGLAPGLSINTLTGVVSGTPTSTTPSGNFSVVFTATNIKGKYTASPTQLHINALPCGVAGVFNGLVDRSGCLNGGFGGTIVVTVQSTGAFTGQLVFGPDKLPFNGVLTIAEPQHSGSAGVALIGSGIATATVNVASPHFALTLQFQIDPYLGELTGTLTDRWCLPYSISDFVGLSTTSGSTDSTGANARFNEPTGLVSDKANNIYVADTDNHVIRKVTPYGVVTTFAGEPGLCGSTDGFAPEAMFHSPEGLAIDASDNLYVADTANSTIRKITPYGQVSTLAGSGGLSGSVDGTGPVARFVCPTGLAVDGAGNVYVADAGDHTIRKITPGGVVTTLAGKSGSPGSANGSGATARFNVPYGIAIDSTGTLVVADSENHVIRSITKTGAVSTLAGAVGVPGSSDGALANARFYGPRGVAVDAYRNIYVLDTKNHTIRLISSAGLVRTVAGNAGISGSVNGLGSAARFNEPVGITVQGGGWVYVTERHSHAIRKGIYTYDVSPVAVLARRNPWGTDSVPSYPTTTGKSYVKSSSTSCYNPPATSLAGTYNLALELPSPLAGNQAYPQGNSFGTLTISTTGIVTWVGVMADGAVTMESTALGGGPYFYGINYIPLHFMLYGNTGSAQGWQVIVTGSSAPAPGTTAVQPLSVSEILIDGVMDWMKIPQSPSVVRSYAAGIPLHVQTTLGEKNVPPTPGTIVLGFSPTANNATLNFYEGGLNPEFSQTFTITTGNTVVMPSGGSNPKLVAMTAFSAATSKFAGNFTLKDSNPISGGTPAQLVRVPTFNGVLLRRLGRGVGYTLVGQLPSVGPPATTLTTAPILSGQVILERANTQVGSVKPR